MKPIAIVIPWFDEHMTGGAERQAFQIATRLAARGHAVEVLTTCSGGFGTDWSSNHYTAGIESKFGLTIRRFQVDPRDSEAFDRVNAKLLRFDNTDLKAGVSPVSHREAAVFVNENIKSRALLEHLEFHHDLYEAFLFLPYMFQATTSGALQVSDRARLQPCLHNEPAAYLPQVAEVFRQVRSILFNSVGEYELALDLFGPGIIQRSEVIGEGVEPIPEGGALPESIQGRKFLLYLGRREAVKNVDFLVSVFSEFKQTSHDSELHLVLAGSGAELLSGPNVIDLGLVSDDVKAALLRNSLALVQPSVNESFSRSMMEAWSVGRPVIVNSSCHATAEAVRTSGGGWTAQTKSEWTHLFQQVEQMSTQELSIFGERGRQYATQHSNWDAIIHRYEELFALNESAQQFSATTSRISALHQLLPDMVYGDAISNQALAIQNHLRRNGYESEIFVKRCEDRMRASAVLFDGDRPERSAGLLYHHSIGSELTTFAMEHAGPKCLIYHNITPADYFFQYRPGFAWLLENGRRSVKRLAPYFRVAVGDSAFNARELSMNGFNQPDVLPIIIDPNRWNLIPDESQMARLSDGSKNILFAGRIAPNKKQDRLVEAFSHFHKLQPESRLIIAGEGRLSDPYFHFVLQTVKRFELESAVEITGVIEESTLLAYYRTAHLYWSFSEHEGFGAPLVESMWFDVPVLALDATAVPETMADAGDLFPAEVQSSDIATRAHRLVNDEELRRTIIERQRMRRLAFTPDAVWPKLSDLITRLNFEPTETAVA